MDVNLAPAQADPPGLTPVPGFIVIGTASNVDLRVPGSVAVPIGAPFIAVHCPGVSGNALQELMAFAVGRQ